MFGLNLQKAYEEILYKKGEELIKSGQDDKVKKLLEKIPSILNGSTDDTANSTYQSLLNTIHDMNSYEEDLNEYNQSSIKSYWYEALILLQAVIKISEESSIEMLEELNEKEIDDKDDLLYSVLFKIHSRSISMAKEILILLRNGFSDGSLARWRSLHESTVIFTLLTNNFQDKDFTYNLIERYIDFSEIEDAKEVKILNRLGFSNLNQDYIQKVDKRRRELIGKYGKEFYYDNFWAAPLFGNRKDRIHFHELENLAELQNLNQYYMRANQQLHLSPKGMVESLTMSSDIDQTSYFLYGSSSFGLSVPLQLTTISLMQITTQFLLLDGTVEKIIIAKILIKLSNKCKTVSNDIYEELEKGTIE
ncbi:DUF5677 domain-containing protein [Bacillus infantis]|uniref:DUF5677 domain-containing protein n=1 Tax=Bacillus infantis TaxID=324767 RepID=UPI003CECFAFF